MSQRSGANDTVDANDIRESLQVLEPTGSPESRSSKPPSTSGMPGLSMCPAPTISKSSRSYTSATSSLPETSSRWDKRSTSRRLRLPMYLLAGSADEVVAPEQLLAVERLVGTRPDRLCHQIAPSNHLGLFMGKRTLEEYWPKIVRWMKQPLL